MGISVRQAHPTTLEEAIETTQSYRSADVSSKTSQKKKKKKIQTLALQRRRMERKRRRREQPQGASQTQSSLR
ncbi:unnamed protein product [Calypogeia fissa]